jgi:hypothetical protein
MNRPLLAIVAAYDALLIVLIFGTRLTVDGAPDLWLYVIGMFAVTVAEAGLLAVSAVRSALKREQNWLTSLMRWPPEWYWAVAGWLSAKFVFLLTLLVWSIVGELSMWLIAAVVTLFTVTHTMFAAQWLGGHGEDAP